MLTPLWHRFAPIYCNGAEKALFVSICPIFGARNARTTPSKYIIWDEFSEQEHHITKASKSTIFNAYFSWKVYRQQILTHRKIKF